MIRTALVLTAVLSSVASGARAQNSIFSIAGIGFQSRQLSTRGRALGGGVGLFDRSSALNPAAVVAFGRLDVSVSSRTTMRSYDFAGTSVGGLRDTRFPDAVVGGPVGASDFQFAVGFSQFFERTFDIAASDTITIRGEAVAVDDRVISDGGIADIRGVVARRLGSRVWAGVSFHLISGSTRATASRTFGSPNFVPFRQTRTTEYSAVGASFGLIVVPTPTLQLAVALRVNSKLHLSQDSVTIGEVSMPVSMSAGLVVRPQLAIGWSTSFSWRSWSSASSDIRALGLGETFDSWEIGSGIEIGGVGQGTSAIPLRFGVRYARLPFSVSSDQPTELNLSGGTALRFASNRAEVAIALERALRKGAGARETAWIFSLGIEIRP